jgi:hypothetical protein
MVKEPVLFNGTVFENVAKGFVDTQRSLADDVQLKLVEEACKSSNAHEFIIRLPQVNITVFHESSSNLSPRAMIPKSESGQADSVAARNSELQLHGVLSRIPRFYFWTKQRVL